MAAAEDDHEDNAAVAVVVPPPHLHGPNCGHFSIAHCDASGQIHVGFISDDGDLTCYAPKPTEAAPPNGSLHNVCLKAQPGDFGMHKLTPECHAEDSHCWAGSHQFLLEPVSVNACHIRSRVALPPALATDDSSHHEHHSHRVMKHDGHLDVFVPNQQSGAVDLHCHSQPSSSCQVNPLVRVPNNVYLARSQDWLDLFVFSNQTSLSTVKVTKGLCCKKEVHKIELLLQDVCSECDLKIQVDAKLKLVTVWHGSDTRAWLPRMLDLLNLAPFACELASVSGEPVSSCVVEGELALDEGELHRTNAGSNQVRLFYLLAQQPAVLQRVIQQGGRLVQVGGAKADKLVVFISKGLCCKKEVPKVEAAVLPVPGVLACVVRPKDKQVDVVVVVQASAEVAEAVRAALAAAGFVVPHHDAVPLEQPLLAPPVAPAAAPPVPAASAGVVRSVLSVQGVCCAAEVPSVLAVCHEVPGVSLASVSVISKQVYVKHNAGDALLAPLVAKRLTDNGFTSTVLVNGAQASSSSSSSTPLTKNTSNNNRVLLTKWYVLLATVLWLVAWLSFVDPKGAFGALKYLAVASCALTLPSIAYKGLLSLRRRIMDINVLMSIAVIGALALQDFHEAATVTVIFSWSEWLEERASRRARGALQALVDLKPDVARTEDGEEIGVDAVVVGQVLVVRSGDKIPVDGVLLGNTVAECDESNLTGESRPVMKREGDVLNAGTLNVSQHMLRMQCTALAENSAVSRMIALVEEAALSRSPTEQIVERVARVYTPVVVLVALLLATVPWAWNDAKLGQEYVLIALTLLVVACPCALIISTPITYVCAMAQAAAFGVMVKGGRHLETLAKLDCLCCDKTGTLTKGQFAVRDCLEVVVKREEAYALLAKIEQHATHPIAQALARYAHAQLPYTEEEGEEDGAGVVVESLEILPGVGVRAQLTGGRRTASVVNQLSSSSMTPAQQTWLDAQRGRTVCWLVVKDEGEEGERVLLGLAAEDEVRASAHQFCAEMKKQGVRMVVLTGDNAGAAELLQRELPLLTEVHAQLKPEDKVEHVRSLSTAQKQQHVVGVCGDGVNDAPAFGIAAVGIAMGVSGAPLAIETADVALMDNDLTKIPRLLRLAKQTRRVIVQNITFALGSKMIMLGLTFAGMITLGVAIAVDVGSMLIVTLNGVRLLSRERGGKGGGGEEVHSHAHHHHHPQHQDDTLMMKV